jgi:TfoX/Sxy family transcriptional regulator of competence genes
MAYDRELAERVRELLAPRGGVDEKPMFGGLAFLVGGHMAVAVSGSGGLMVRVAPDETARWLREAHVEPMVMSGREVRGWVRVQPAGLSSRRTLAAWVQRGADHATTL